MNIILELIGAYILVLSFGILFQAPKRSLWLLGLTGFLSWAGFLVAKSLIGNTIIAIFIASILVGITGEVFARLKKLPVTVFVIAGIIPLVPGIPAYHTMLNLVEGRYIEGVQTGMETLMIAGAIALAIAIVGSIPRKMKS